MSTVRWGIIGVGDVTEVKSGPGFQKATHSELVAVMRRTAHLAEDYAHRHNVPRWYDDAQALINDPEVDAIYIATPPDSHKQYTLMAAAAGKPVYVEKPMALDVAECQAMLDACKAAGVPLFVAYYRRTLPRMLKVKELVDMGAIGVPRSATIMLHQRVRQGYMDRENLAWRVLPAVAGGGIFVDMGSHMLDFLDYVLGPITTVQGVATNQGGYYPAEDNVSASFVFESGVLGIGNWCFTSYQEVDQMEIIGTKGKVTFSAFDESPIVLRTAEQTETFEIPNPPHVQQPLIQTIVDELTGVGTCPSTGESGARTAQVIDRILAEYREEHLA